MPCFHFDEYYFIVIFRHNVDFTALISKVLFEYFKTMPLKILYRSCFPICTL